MLRETVEELEQNEILGFSKKEKADAQEIAQAVTDNEAALTRGTNSAIHDLLAKLSRKGNKTANSELHNVMSDKKWALAFIAKWLKKLK